MKKTLQEQQKRIKEIMIPDHTSDRVDITKGGTYYRMNVNGEEIIIIFENKNIESMIALKPTYISKEDKVSFIKDIRKFFELQKK